MALSTPTLIATAANFNAGGLTTLAATTTVGANVGDLVMVVTAGNRSGTTSIADTRLNTWSAAANTATAINSQFNIHYSVITTQIQVGDTITGTYPSSPSRFIYAYVVTGAATSTPLDKVASTASVGSLSWTSGNTATLSQAAEIVFGGSVSNTNAAITSTPTNSNIELIDTEDANQVAVTVTYKIVAATTAVAATGTWSGGLTTAITAAVATFKEATAGGATATGATMLMMGI